jgi:hypothetical protein
MSDTQPHLLVKQVLELQTQIDSQNRSFQKAIQAIGERRDVEAVNELGEIVTRSPQVADAASDLRAEIDRVRVA